MITVIDYGAGNLRSVENALHYLGAPYQVTSKADEVAQANALLLPGVGHFGQMMRSLAMLDLILPIKEALGRKVPYLGICLGMHALFEASEEAPALPGLGILSGTIRRFTPGLKVPHMGWNQLQLKKSSRLFRGLSGDPYVYFAHYFYLPQDKNSKSASRENAAALTSYGIDFVAAIERGNLQGVQFHPEKSGDIGLRVVRNFVDDCLRSAGERD